MAKNKANPTGIKNRRRVKKGIKKDMIEIFGGYKAAKKDARKSKNTFRNWF